MSYSLTPEPPGTERNLRSARNPRRRQRQSDGESIKSAPRRKRSKLSEDNFVPPRYTPDGAMNGYLEESGHAPMNGDAHHAPAVSIESQRGTRRSKKEGAVTFALSEESTTDMQIPVREKKKGTVKRSGTRGDGATVLTQNDRYVVRMLPSTPRELRQEGLEYRAMLGAEHRALAVTRKSAFIWDYTSHTPVNSPRVFDVPFTTRSGDPLPFGSLVTSAGSAETGLLLVSATTGKIVFHESIERAASLGLFQGSDSGTQGSLGGLFSGETVTDLITANHAGFVIVLSSGRIAQLTLRDAQGKARVSTQFLRAAEQGSNGMLGGFLGLLGGGAWKRDVAAVHTRTLGTKGQMQVVSLTEHAELQMWDVDWNGSYNFRGTFEFKDVISKELSSLESAELQGRRENIAALDFAIAEAPADGNRAVTTFGSDHPIKLLLLLRVGTLNDCNYVLLDIEFEGSEANISRVMQFDTYHSSSTHVKPRLLLPKPRHSAIIAFEDAMVIAETAESATDSPDAQLHASYTAPEAFEDAVFLQPGQQLSVLGAYEEEPRGHHACTVAFIKSAGLVRIAIADPSTTDQTSRISIKTKIEQAIFHGALQEHNILNFARQKTAMYSVSDVEAAVLEISSEILSSTSSFISTAPTSIEAQLASKAQALHALAAYVRRNYPALSNRTLWQLLSDAERVAAAQEMWLAFEEHVVSTSQPKRKATITDEVCAIALEETETSSEELARFFFIHRLDHIEQLLRLALDILRMLEKETAETPERKLQLALQANDLWIRAMETVFAFRQQNAHLYGINPQFIESGVLADEIECAELPEFWSSTESMLKAVVNVANISRDFAADEYGRIEKDSPQTAVLEPLIRKISDANPRLIQLLCLTYQERINWLASRRNDHDNDRAAKLKANYDQTRHMQFRALSNIAQTEAGLQLAENYRDMRTLTMMVVGEMQYAISCLQSPESPSEDSRAAIMAEINDMTARVGRYFDRFGDDFANAYFDEGFSGARAGTMLREAQENWPDALTRYLRADPHRAKICWVNDVMADGSFEHAGQSLLFAATEIEESLWAKKIELSMAKLSVLAAAETKNLSTRARDTMERTALQELKVANVQERVLRHVTPEIIGCIDREAEFEVAMQKFGYRNQDLHALRKLLETYMERLLSHQALSVDELIDLLTLMDSVVVNEAEYNLDGQEFVYALKVLDAVAPVLPQERFESLLGLIWKRCYTSDNWAALSTEHAQQQKNNVESNLAEMMSSTNTWRTLYHCCRQDLFSSQHWIGHLTPSNCMGAGSTLQELRHRWTEDSGLLEPVAADNHTHDEQLQGFIDEQQIDEWAVACEKEARKLAQADIEAEADQEGRLREMEASVRQREVNDRGFDRPVKVEELENDEGPSELGESIEMDADAAVTE